MRDIPRLSWLSGKTQPQHTGRRKNDPGRVPEHAAALDDNFIYDGLVTPDLIDTCLVCGVEIPPGPDTCSAECETKMREGLKNEAV